MKNETKKIDLGKFKEELQKMATVESLAHVDALTIEINVATALTIALAYAGGNVTAIANVLDWVNTDAEVWADTIADPYADPYTWALAYTDYIFLEKKEIKPKAKHMI